MSPPIEFAHVIDNQNYLKTAPKSTDGEISYERC